MEFGVRLLFVLHHQIDVLRSFVSLHDSPSARLADRVLMIHELRGSNPTPTKSFTSSAHLLCVLLDREFPVICLVILQLCFDIHIPNGTGTFSFLYPLLWRFAVILKKTRLSLVQYQSFGRRDLARTGMLNCFSTPASKCPRNWQ